MGGQHVDGMMILAFHQDGKHGAVVERLLTRDTTSMGGVYALVHCGAMRAYLFLLSVFFHFAPSFQETANGAAAARLENFMLLNERSPTL